MMKQLFIFLLSLIALTSNAQYKRSQMTRQYTPYSQVGAEFRTVLYAPLDTMSGADIGALAYLPSDSSYYVKRVNKWVKVSATGSGVDSTALYRGFYTTAALGISASSNVTNYAAGKVDSIFYKFSTTPYGTGTAQDYGGWLTGNLTGDSIKVTAPFWVAIGNSIIEGHPAQHGRLHPSIDLTKQDVPGQITYYLRQLTNMRFFNQGIGGQTSSDVWARWDRDVLGKTVAGITTLSGKPQGVLIECGINDFYSGISVETLKKNLTKMAASAAREGIYCVTLTIPGDEINNYIQNKQVDEINDWLRKGGLNKYNVSIVDFNRWWKDSAYKDNKHGNSLLADDIHPTEVGYDSAANFIFREGMLPVLEGVIFYNELSPDGFAGYARPNNITFNNTAYSITKEIDTLLLTAPLIIDTPWIKVLSSNNITGTSYTGFSQIEYLMSYPVGNNAFTIGRKASGQTPYPYIVIDKTNGNVGIQTETPATPFEVNSAISRGETVPIGPELRTYLNLSGGQGPSSHTGKGGFYVVLPDARNNTFANIELDVTDAKFGTSKILIGLGNSTASVTYTGYMNHFPPLLQMGGKSSTGLYIVIGDSTYDWDYPVLKISRVNLYAGFSLANYASYDSIKVRFTTSPISFFNSIGSNFTYTINSLNTFAFGTQGTTGVTGIPFVPSITSESLLLLDTVSRQWKRTNGLSGSVPGLTYKHFFVGDVTNTATDAGNGLIFNKASNTYTLSVGINSSADSGVLVLGGSAGIGQINFAGGPGEIIGADYMHYRTTPTGPGHIWYTNNNAQRMTLDGDGGLTVNGLAGVSNGIGLVNSSGKFYTSSHIKFVDSNKAIRASKLLAYKQVQAGDTVFRFAPRKYNYGFGNSLMAGSAITPDYFRYFTMFCNFTNDLEVNYGIGGTRLCHVSTGDSCMLDRLYRIKNYNAATDDYFVFEYGVNDAVTLSIDTATFRATYYQVIDTAIIARGIPAAKITLLTPGFYLHNNSTLQNRGPIFTDLVKSIAAAKGVKVVDARAAQVLAGAMATLNLPTDSVHWNEYGNEAVALAMIDTLNIKSGVVRANGNLYGRHLTIRGYANKTPFLSLVDTAERIVSEFRAYSHISTGTNLESQGFGLNSLIAETSGNGNTAFGSGTLQADTSGSNNTAFGSYVLAGNLSGNNNTVFGKNGYFSNTTGNENTGMGRDAGKNNTTGSDNTYGGYTSGVANTTSSNNTGWGSFTLNANTASSNTATGASALRFNTSGGSNTANGTNSLLSNLTGANNTAMGNRSLRGNTGSNNTADGANAGDSNTTGGDNTYIGYRNFYRSKTGSRNIGLGAQVGTDVFAGSDNIYIGGSTILLGDVSNTLLISAGQNSPRIYSPASGKVMIGSVNTPTTTLHVDGDLRIGTVASSTVGVDSLLTIHNGVVQAIAPTALPAYSEGAYIPTLTGVANIDGVTADSLHYYRYGNNVTVYGAFQADPTLNLVTTQIGVSLVPGLASNFTLAHQASGGVNLSINGYPGKVYADATNDRAQIEFVAAATSNMSFTINFTYKIQ